ncbi:MULTISPECIES: hypothetical protein [Rhizobium/Agrobacterium group]|jgi:cob(I)alamin adenosyltransferase|uniref:hypothetical protein n=1 Tax=Rhizobium/Agrobacterium group TaxID=227290 RepID=UPI00071505BF|nr:MULTISPECIES: hypothetical protein [Rhizobium/Agrobacterium group]KQY27545.1 hypothetical protein ASD32_25135 [Rhizobium sp. Root483D2]
MIRSVLIAGATIVALSTSAYAQNMTVTCDDAGMTKLKSEAETVKQEHRTEVMAAIGDASMAMQAGKMDECMASMQKAMTAIHK